MEYKQIRNLNGKDQWQQPTFTWEGFTLYLSLDLSPSMSPAYLGALCGFSLSWKSNLHLSVVPLPEDSVFTQGGGEGGSRNTHTCMYKKYTHAQKRRKTPKNVRQTAPHSVRRYRQSKVDQRQQPLLLYSLSAKRDVGAAVLAKERERKVRRGVDCC